MDITTRTGGGKVTTFDYEYDGIGNRTDKFTVNLLNQYTVEFHNGGVVLTGTAEADARVTVNNLETTRNGNEFSINVPLNNWFSPIKTHLK